MNTIKVGKWIGLKLLKVDKTHCIGALTACQFLVVLKVVLSIM